jgi:integrase
MSQRGQVFELKAGGPDGKKLWAYRYRAGGRGSRRVQQGGFESERAAAEALERALGRLRREQGLVEAPRLSELVDVYLAQHDGEPETVAKLRWLLAKAVRVFGHRRVSQLRPAEIAAWRMTIASRHRFEATQALRQVLARAVSWGLIDVNPAKQGVDNPQRRRTEKRPFESWAELDALATKLEPCYGPLVLFAAATGLRPGEWIALEHRDVDRDERVLYVRRAYRNGRVKCPKTEASMRAVPLQTIALTALERLPAKAKMPTNPSGAATAATFAGRFVPFVSCHAHLPRSPNSASVKTMITGARTMASLSRSQIATSSFFTASKRGKTTADIAVAAAPIQSGFSD